MSAEAIAAARFACQSATARFAERDGRCVRPSPVPRDPAVPGQLRARRDAANRLAPLANGVRDPFGARAGEA